MRIPDSIADLTDAQRTLFDDHLDLARAVCGRFISRRKFCGAERNDDLRSAAMLGLLEACARYTAAKAEEVGFRTFAATRIWWAMVERGFEVTTGAISARGHRRRYGVVGHWGEMNLDPLLHSLDGDLMFADRGRDDRDLVDARDEAAAILRRLKPRERAILSRHYLDGVPLEAVASEVGVCRAHVFGLRDAALRRAKEVCR